VRSSMSVNFDSSSSQDRIVDSQLEISLLLSDMANTVSSTTHTLSRKHVFVHRLPQRNHCRAAIQCRNSDRFRKLHVSQSLSRVENCFVNPDACSLDQGRRFASSASSPKVLVSRSLALLPRRSMYAFVCAANERFKHQCLAAFAEQTIAPWENRHRIGL